MEWTRQKKERERREQVKKLRQAKKGVNSYVYVITNPAWNNWCKIGKADNVDKRLKNYNTGSPLRDYEVYFSWFVKNTDLYESEFKIIFGNAHEWHEIHPEVAKDMILEMYRRYQDPTDDIKTNVLRAKSIIDHNRSMMAN